MRRRRTSLERAATVIGTTLEGTATVITVAAEAAT